MGDIRDFGKDPCIIRGEIGCDREVEGESRGKVEVGSMQSCLGREWVGWVNQLEAACTGGALVRMMGEWSLSMICW